MRTSGSSRRSGRSRRGAVGHVYNVYGPELVEYAEKLLGEHP
jgi:hypothetical protein